MARYNVAILGASGAVGQSLLEIYTVARSPVAELFPLGRAQSEGDFVVWWPLKRNHRC